MDRVLLSSTEAGLHHKLCHRQFPTVKLPSVICKAENNIGVCVRILVLSTNEHGCKA